jgi:hypothetical protein
MVNNDTELLFPSRVISALESERGKEWQDLVTEIMSKDPGDSEYLAFVLMMAELNGCGSCSSDSFRAMRGCTQCALQNIRRFKADDSKLIKLYEKSSKEINNKLK